MTSEVPPLAARGLRERLIAQIQFTGPITIAEYMTIALHDPAQGYYATRPGIGADFITAPEISQMFGELIGAWCAHEWSQLGSPAPFTLTELGPGTGALMRDVLRAAKFGDAARVTLIDASPTLRARQAETLAQHAPVWANDIASLDNGPTLLLGNELLDCLPIRQFVRTSDGWRERLIGVRDGALAFGLAQSPLPDDAIIPENLRSAPEGAIAEIAIGAEALIMALAEKLHPGRALFLDYGSTDETGGDTFQALAAHTKVDPLAAPGEADLTAHVDFTAIARFARTAGLDVYGPVSQASFLRTLGLDQRAEALAHANPERAERIAREHARLTAPEQMGELFKVICLSSPNLPPPAGF